MLVGGVFLLFNIKSAIAMLLVLIIITWKCENNVLTLFSHHHSGDNWDRPTVITWICSSSCKFAQLFGQKFTVFDSLAFTASFSATPGNFCLGNRFLKTCVSRQTQLETNYREHIVEQLATEAQFLFTLSRWRRPKTKLKESKYWTYMHLSNRNMTPNENWM